MALNENRLDMAIRSGLTSKGFELNEQSGFGWWVAKACAKCVVEINSSAIVIVPPHAGGTYKVTALSPSGMQSKILAEFVSLGMKVSGDFAFGKYLPIALSNAISDEVLANCQVSIPVDGSGEFHIINMNEQSLTGRLKSNLTSFGFVVDGKFQFVGRMAEAISKAVTAEMNANAIVAGSFVAGGPFPVL